MDALTAATQRINCAKKVCGFISLITTQQEKKDAWLYIFEDKIKHQTSQHKIKKETSKHRVRDAHEIGSDCFVVYDVR